MNLTISIEKIDNSLLVELLRKLTKSFHKLDRDFYVIGATARDIILQELANTSSRRKTRDLDIAIAIPGWDTFEHVIKVLKADGFKKDAQLHQRFYYNDYELDIVPYGLIAKDDDQIYWPPEENIAMSVKGFDEVLKDAITVSIGGEFNIKIASLHGLFLLKFNAWIDRHFSTSKDAEDMSFILDNYCSANENRNFHTEVYNWNDFNPYVVGGYWLAFDLISVLQTSQIRYYKDQIDKEISKGEGSRLFNQMLDNSCSLTFEQISKTWQTISDVFKTGLS